MKITRRDVTASVAAMIVLPKAALSRTMTDLRLLRIPGVEAFAYRDESTLPSLGATLFTVLLPIGLMLMKTVAYRI